MKFTLLKTCLRGKVGDIVDVHGNDVTLLAYNNVIDPNEHNKPKAHTEKAEVKAPKKKAK